MPSEMNFPGVISSLWDGFGIVQHLFARVHVLGISMSLGCAVLAIITREPDTISRRAEGKTCLFSVMVISFG